MDGGLLNLKRSAGLCDAAGLPVVKHSLGELGVRELGLHRTACRRCACRGPLAPRDGTLAVPTSPGLGVDLDAERVDRYAELFEREGATYAFTDPSGPTPLLPKR